MNSARVTYHSVRWTHGAQQRFKLDVPLLAVELLTVERYRERPLVHGSSIGLSQEETFHATAHALLGLVRHSLIQRILNSKSSPAAFFKRPDSKKIEYKNCAKEENNTGYAEYSR